MAHATTRTRHSTRSRSTTSRSTTAERSGAFMLLAAVLVVLTLVGLVMVLSASSITALREYGSSWYFFKRELLWLAGGSVLLLVTMRIDYHRWRHLTTPVLAVAVGLLVLVLAPGFGANINGSSRWIVLGPLQVQPGELAKLGLLLWTADMLARREAWIRDTRVTVRPVLVVTGVVALLLVLQPNLGTTLVVAAIVFAVLFSSGVRTAPLTGWAGLSGLAAVTLALSAGYRRRRLFSFLDPWADPLNTGYQTIQSQVSLASGGLFGVGLGASRAKWGFLPYAHTDFIFAIIGEELGLLGASLVVGLFATLGYLGVRTALHAPDSFGRLVAVGITTWFCVQALVNIGAVVGILPITGVPLPFVSYGGSSLLATMAAAGILLNVARQAR